MDVNDKKTGTRQRMNAAQWCRAYLYDDSVAVKPVSLDMEYIVFAGMGLLLIVMGIMHAGSFAEVVEGYRVMLTHPVLLDFDALKWSGYGASFINAGIMTFIVLLVYRVTRTDLQGAQIAALMMVAGFSFYGKNPVNVWFPVLGVFINAKVHKQPLCDASALAWFSTSLSPVFSVLAFGTPVLGPGSPLAICLGAVFGILAGILVGGFSTYLPHLHKGRVLYNAGFAAGLAGLIINAILTAFGLGHDRYPYLVEDYVSGDNRHLALMLIILFLYFIVVGVMLHGAPRYRKMLWHRCFGGNFIREFGFSTSLVNMGVVGFMALIYVLATSTGQITGPIFACLFTAIGFAAAGVTVREYLPTMLGVGLAAFISGGVSTAIHGGDFWMGAVEKIGSRPMILAAVFSCGLSPIVGTFSWVAGMFVGALHSFVVPLTGSLHAWMSLYNNGFSMGLIVVFLFPMYRALKLGRKEREIHIGPED